MNRARTTITREALAGLLGYSPADGITITHVHYNQDYGTLYVYMNGDSFPEVAEGSSCPDFSRPIGLATPNAVTVKQLTQPGEHNICPNCHKEWVEENYE